jgi:hypothetical protein
MTRTGESRRLQLELRGAESTGQGLHFVLTGSDRRAHNVPGRPREVDVQQTSLTEGAGREVAMATGLATLYLAGAFERALEILR